MGPESMCCGSYRPSSSPSWKSIDCSIRSLRFLAIRRPKAYSGRMDTTGMATRTTGMRAGKKDFLDVAASSKADVETLLGSAALLKDQEGRGVPHGLLRGKMLGLTFRKPSTRTSVSF